jgi:hypothetical protein
MAIQQMGDRGQVAAEMLDRRRGSHCEDRKQVRSGPGLFPSF